jgi:hypothetical protein
MLRSIDGGKKKVSTKKYKFTFKDGKTLVKEVDHLGWDGINTNWILGFGDDEESSDPLFFIDTVDIKHIEDITGE